MKKALIVFSLFVMAFSTCNASLRPDLELVWYTQPLDHFVFGVEKTNQTFQQRVYVDRSYLDGRTSLVGVPILVYLGPEDNIDYYVGGGGVMTLAAFKFRALVVYIEHRFYGQSVPLGSIDAALTDPYIRGCLNSAQALADFANVIKSLKSQWATPHSPVIVFGGSYAGTLAAWFRMKYPNIVDGALASSAPILDSIDVTPENEYCSIVSRDFKNVDEKCYQYVAQSWRLIDEVAERPDGLDQLSHTFNTCEPLLSASDLKFYLAGTYSYVAQYNGRYGQIGELCGHISQAPEDNILKGIGDAFLTFTQQTTCNDVTMTPDPSDPTSQMSWDWQVCSELISHEGCSEPNILEKATFNLTEFMESCYDQYGVYPHPNWISTYYGDETLKTALKASSNIIFSNGLMDPYSGTSILEDISKTIVAIKTKEGSHCLDLESPKNDDPKWLKNQRKKELKIITHWIKAAQSSGLRMILVLSRLLMFLLLAHFFV